MEVPVKFISESIGQYFDVVEYREKIDSWWFIGHPHFVCKFITEYDTWKVLLVNLGSAFSPRIVYYICKDGQEMGIELEKVLM